jgi:hypothetical protein
MLSDFLFIAVGVATVLWARWLLPRQLSGVRAKMPVDRQRRFDSLLQRRSVRSLFAASGVCGVLLIAIGEAKLKSLGPHSSIVRTPYGNLKSDLDTASAAAVTRIVRRAGVYRPNPNRPCPNRGRGFVFRSRPCY